MKNKTTNIVLVSALIVIILVPVIIGGIYYALREEQLNVTERNLAYLQKAIIAYKQDAEKAGRTSVYPQTLRSLVDSNYINNPELRELTDGAVVEYFMPTNTNDPSVVILKATVGRNVYECALFGPVKRH